MRTRVMPVAGLAARALAAGAVAVAVAAGGCGKGGGACGSEARELAAFLRAANTGPSPIYIDRDIVLVERAAASRTATYAPSVTIAKDGALRFGGATEISTSELGRQLARQRDLGATRAPEQVPAVYLAIDAGAPWPRVVEAVTTAFDEGYREVGFAFAIGVASTPPARTWVDDKLDAMLEGEATDRAVQLAELVGRITMTCPSLEQAFGRVSGDDGEDKATYLIDALEPALVACHCDLDIPALRSVMYRVMHDELAAGIARVALAGEDQSGAIRLAAPATATWAEVAARVGGDVPLVRLDVGD